MKNKINTLIIKDMKKNREKITMATAYDYSSARILDEAGIELVLVGDSLGMVVLGLENTLAVTLDDMIHHGKAVVRGVSKAMVVIDMPFMTYKITWQEAMRNAGRVVQETGAPAVKLEGGEEVAETVSRIVHAGIPVVAHIGLTPQSVGELGGFLVQGKNEKVARRLLKDAQVLEEAGAFSIVLEAIPWQLAKLITESVSIPTIGIGAGVNCDGQVLVYHDLLGLQTELRPKFVKQYGNFYNPMVNSIQEYIKEVKEASFPADEHSFTMDEEILQKIRRDL